MVSVSDMIELMWKPPRKERGVKRQHVDRTLPENFKYYGHWGYTLYRTHYSPESDEHWDTLLDALKRQTYLALGYLDSDEIYRYDAKERKCGEFSHSNRDEYTSDLERVKKLFHLDLREDSSLLNGLNVRQLRKVCLDEHPKAEKRMAGMFRCALFADEAVLKDIARGVFIVKVVAYDWEEDNEYWGWMRVPTGYLLELWHILMMSPFNHHRVLCFEGPEEDLEKYIWAGDVAAYHTSSASEIRPGYVHYSSQRPEFGFDPKSRRYIPPKAGLPQ